MASATPSETQRLARLRDLEVLDTGPEPLFDTLVLLAAQACGAPIALLSLVDERRQWFKAAVGLPGISEVARELTLCDHTLRQAELLEVPDASRDPRFAGLPLVTGSPPLRFYAGIPLVLSGGECVGTLCVADHQPRALSAGQGMTLRHLAQAAAQALEMRQALVARSRTAAEAQTRDVHVREARLHAILDAQSELVSQSTLEGRLIYVNPAYALHFGSTVAGIVGTNLFDYVDARDRDLVRERIEWVLSTGQSLSTENRMHSASGEERWVSWTNTRQQDEHGQPMLHSTGRDVSARVRAERALRISSAFLARTGRLAGVGGWQMDLATQRITWSDETRRLHEVDDGYQPTLESALAFYTPAARTLVEAAVQEGLSSGKPWDLELPLVTARGRPIWARAVGEVESDNGVPVRLIGAFQDITERHELQRRLADSEGFLRLLTDSLPARIAYLDHERRYRFVNQEWCRVTGLQRDAVIGRTRSELLPGGDDPRLRERATAALAGQAQQFEFDDVSAGQVRRIENRLVPDRDEAGAVRGFFVIGIDVTERVRSERILRSVADAIPSAVAVIDAKGRYRFVNQAFAAQVGLPADDVLGRHVVEVLGADEYERRRARIGQALAGERVHFELETPGAGSARYTSLEYIPLVLGDSERDGLVVVSQDITAAKREQLRLHLLSQTDKLTGLLNRAGFEQRAHNLLQDGGDEPVAVIYVDLDRFKAVNDTLGHAAGDEVLKLMARRMVRLVRPYDAVARLGGDEFVVLLPGMGDLAQTERVARSIVEAARLPFILSSEREVRIGASVGGALGRSVPDAWERLLDHADRMLYQAKAAGRDGWAVTAAAAP